MWFWRSGNCHAFLHYIASGQLNRVFIKRKLPIPCIVHQHALSLLSNAAITSLCIFGKLENANEAVEHQNMTTLEQFGDMILPWTESLVTLAMQSCHLVFTDGRSFSSPGFLARFLNLSIIELMDVSTSPAFNTLDLSGCTGMKDVLCLNCNITSIDLTMCRNLRELQIYGNKLTTLDLSDCINLKTINVGANNLTFLHLSPNQKTLEVLSFEKNHLTAVDLSHCKQLQILSCSDNALEVLDVPMCERLHTIVCVNNGLNFISSPGSIKKLLCGRNNLISLDLTECSSMEELNCYDNMLSSLSFPALGCAALRTLICQRNFLTVLNLTGCDNLFFLNCSNNPLSLLNVSACSGLAAMHCSDCELTAVLDLALSFMLKDLKCNGNQLDRIVLCSHARIEDLLVFNLVAVKYWLLRSWRTWQLWLL